MICIIDFLCRLMRALLILSLMLHFQLNQAGLTATSPQLNLHFIDPDPGALLSSYDVDIESQQNYLFYTLTCKSPGNEVTVRISPGDQTTVFIDRDMEMTGAALYKRSCIPSRAPPTVNCSQGDYCESANQCNVNLISACPSQGSGLSSWQMTRYIDITMGTDSNKLYILRCFETCGAPDETAPSDAADSSEVFPDYAIGVVVAGAVLLAIVIITVAVIWNRKCRNHSSETPSHKKPHVSFAE